MYHPFKKLEKAWNSRTPEYLHPRTKANLIWQLKMVALLLAGMFVKDMYEERQAARRRKSYNIEDITTRRN